MKTFRTPGPWVAKKKTYSDAWVLLWPSAAGQHMKRIDSAGEFMEHDARLMAAAPELLQFAEEVRRSGDTRLASMAIAVLARVNA